MSNGSDGGNWLIDAVLWALGVIVTLLGGASEYNRRKLDKVADRQSQFVTRVELSEIIRRAEDEADLKHQQNLTAMSNLTARIDRVLERM